MNYEVVLFELRTYTTVCTTYMFVCLHTQEERPSKMTNTNTRAGAYAQIARTPYTRNCSATDTKARHGRCRWCVSVHACAHVACVHKLILICHTHTDHVSRTVSVSHCVCVCVYVVSRVSWCLCLLLGLTTGGGGKSASALCEEACYI